MRISLFLFLLLVEGIALGEPRLYGFGAMGHAMLCVREEDLFPGELNKARSDFSDGEPMFIFLLPGEIIRARVPSYMLFANSGGDITGTIEIKKRIESNRPSHDKSLEGLDGSGGNQIDSRHSVVEGVSVFKRQASGETFTWRIVSKKLRTNNETSDGPEKIEAICHVFGLKNRRPTCLRSIEYSRFEAKYYFDERNLSSLFRIDSVVKSRIADWEGRCSIRH